MTGYDTKTWWPMLDWTCTPMGLVIYERHRRILTRVWAKAEGPIYTIMEKNCLESSKLYHYANYKHVYEVSSYVKLIDLIKLRCCIANLRSCAHNLKIEEGRDMGLISE